MLVQQILDITVEALGLVAGSAFEQFAAILRGMASPRASRLSMLPRMEVNGVRKSWDTEASKALRSCSVSPCRRADSNSCPNCARASAWASGWLNAVNEEDRRCPLNSRPGLALTPSNPKGPSSPDSGHHHQRPNGKVPVHAGRLIMLPGPVGGGAFSFGEGQRATGLDLPAALSIAIDQAQVELVPTDGGRRHQ